MNMIGKKEQKQNTLETVKQFHIAKTQYRRVIVQMTGDKQHG